MGMLLCVGGAVLARGGQVSACVSMGVCTGVSDIGQIMNMILNGWVFHGLLFL